MSYNPAALLAASLAFSAPAWAVPLAIFDGNSVGGGPTAAGDVAYYEFTLAAPTNLTLDTFGADFDTELGLFFDPLGAGTLVTSNDDVGGTLQSELLLPGLAAGDYQVALGGFDTTFGDGPTVVGGNANGNYLLNVGVFASPSNDLPTSPETLTPGVVTTVDNTFATADSGEVSPGAGSGPSSCQSQDGWCSFETGVQNSLWYAFALSMTSYVAIDALQTLDLQFALWQATDLGACPRMA